MQTDSTIAFSETNYGGNSYILKSYDSSVTDRIIKSIKLPMGYTLTFFSDSNFKQVGLQLDAKLTCEMNPNYEITFRSYILQNYNSPKYAIGSVINPKDAVVFYSDSLFKGTVLFKAYSNFEYNRVDLSKVNSIYIPEGYYLDFYELSLHLYHHVLYIKALHKIFTANENFKVVVAYPSPVTKCTEHKSVTLASFISWMFLLITVALVVTVALILLYKKHHIINLLHASFTKNKKNYNLWLFLFITFIFLTSLAFIVEGHYVFNDRHYMNFMDSLQKNYMRLNSVKTAVFSFIHILVYILFAFIILYKKLSLKYLLLLTFTVGLCWLVFFLYYMPCQTPFGLTYFGKLYKPQNNSTHTVTTFLAIGDPQEFGNNFNRYKNNKLAVSTMNKFITETYPILQQSNMTDIMGCLIPGDCTQTGQDGRLFTNNYIGDYELNYGLGDMSELKVPVYECTGNHDWDVTVEVNKPDKLYFKTCPAVNMINRRNNYRKIVTQDKNGNYMWKFNQLFCIAINCWPAPEPTSLLSGKPKGSLKFLEKAVSMLSMEDKFIILTHHIPIPVLMSPLEDFKPPAFYIANPTLKNTPCEQLLNIIESKKNNLLAIVLGHLHLDQAWTKVTDDNIRVIIPPAPANSYYTGSFVMFSYDDSTKKLSALEIQSNGIANSLF